MVRKIVACVVLVFAVVVLASIALRLTTFSVKAALGIASMVVGIIGAIGLFRAWPHAHLMAGVLPLVIGGLSVWNAAEMHMNYGDSIYSTAYVIAAAVLVLALVIYDYFRAETAHVHSS